jgi:hypothetical protein
VCLVLLVFVLCRVPNVASFSRLPILFLIAPSVFSNVYVIQQKEFGGAVGKFKIIRYLSSEPLPLYVLPCNRHVGIQKV